MRAVGRAIGLDVHLEFCEVAIAGDGVVRSQGRIETTPERLELFGASLHPQDRVALEVTGNAWEIARILESHVARVIVVTWSMLARAFPLLVPPVRSPARFSAPPHRRRRARA